MITLDHVTRMFGKFKAVNDLSIHVQAGEVLGFLGPNGAGKTTTMRMISGFLPPTNGKITVCGIDVDENPVEIKRHIGYMPEQASSYPDMTVIDFLNFIAKARGISESQCEKSINNVIQEVGLTNVLYQTIETLSKGYKRRVGLAQALVHDPEILILDEPTEGLDPNQKKEIRSLIRRIKENKAIIISTHVLEEVEAICTRAVIIDQGKIVLDDTPRNLLSLSQTHQTIYFLIPSFQADRAKTVFEQINTIKSFEMFEQPNDLHQFAIIPKNHAQIAPDLVEILHRQDIKVIDMYMEKGRLEEVFYAFTTMQEKGTEE